MLTVLKEEMEKSKFIVGYFTMSFSVIDGTIDNKKSIRIQKIKQLYKTIWPAWHLYNVKHRKDTHSFKVQMEHLPRSKYVVPKHKSWKISNYWNQTEHFLWPQLYYVRNQEKQGT